MPHTICNLFFSFSVYFIKKLENWLSNREQGRYERGDRKRWRNIESCNNVVCALFCSPPKTPHNHPSPVPPPFQSRLCGSSPYGLPAETRTCFAFVPAFTFSYAAMTAFSSRISTSSIAAGGWNTPASNPYLSAASSEMALLKEMPSVLRPRRFLLWR